MVTLGDSFALQATSHGTISLNINSQIVNENEILVAKASRVGSLYFLNCQSSYQQTDITEVEDQTTKENLWHQHYDYLGIKGL